LNSSDDESTIVPWSDNYLVERLTQQLAIVEETSAVFDNRKYYNRAYEYLKYDRFNPESSFIINLSDLTPALINEFYALNDSNRELVLELSVAAIFEYINSELYHNSISMILNVRLHAISAIQVPVDPICIELNVKLDHMYVHPKSILIVASTLLLII
jgi:hypothetical protein